MSSPPRIALFGGTFDPVHLGHAAMAEAAFEKCALDRVIFVPAACSPFKKDGDAAADEHRLAMCNLAVGGLDFAEVSEFELQQDGTSYSWRTVEHFRATLPPRTELHSILGADQWDSLDRWKRADYLAENLHFIAFGREGQEIAPRDGYRHTPLPIIHPASSTAIRAAVAGEGDPAALEHLHPDVGDYIAEHGLYLGGGTSAAGTS